ncbi:MAG: Rpn family recombination-promoting nuclease/putative transposase [Methanobrevibacter sp.]|nr:Rpn family recombination-promoting nuclease/putative transposase [Methanobrevibacter sp.]
MDDFFFHKYMGEKGNELQQKSFLKTLGINITGKMTTTNTQINPDKEKGKEVRLDSRIITGCGKDINIEAQRIKTEDFLERLITYACKRLIEPVSKGQNYNKFKKVIFVAICVYSFLDSPKYHNVYYLKNSNIYINETLIDKIEIHFIEIEKFRKSVIYEEDPNDNTKIIKTRKDLKNNLKHQYIAFFDDETSHELRREIVKMGDEGLKASMKNLELAIQNGLFDEYFLIKLEEAHQENVGNERENKGRKEREEEIALKLKNDGFPYEKIAEITGLSLSEIEEL